MQKEIAISYHGTLGQVGDLQVKRMLPNRYTLTVGPFFFLDYLLPSYQQPKEPEIPKGVFAHPHRGIATFTYLLSGEVEHFDSRGNHGIVGAGGAQWMKAGNGIIHDENPSRKFQESGGTMHGLQFWINLPEKNKAESPEYMGLQPDHFKEVALPGKVGKIRVLIGEYQNAWSPVPTYSHQFNYHLTLNAGATFILEMEKNFESALFIPSTKVLVNGGEHSNGELLVFGIEGDSITLTNPNVDVADIILFGGEAYTEPIVAEGPFVMNSATEIGQAYRDYNNGKYGEINYSENTEDQK